MQQQIIQVRSRACGAPFPLFPNSFWQKKASRMSYDLIVKEEDGKEIYPCDFRNKKVFPPFNELPFEGDSTSRFYMAPACVTRRRQHWCYFGQIESLRARSPCLMLAVEDMYTGQWEIPVILTFPENQIDVESLQPGHTIAILYPERSFCLGENVVVRVRDPAKIKVIAFSRQRDANSETYDLLQVFPCDLDTLLQINEVMEEQTSLDDYVRCANCGKKENRDTPPLPRCSRCLGISYCGVVSSYLKRLTICLPFESPARTTTGTPRTRTNARFSKT